MYFLKGYCIIKPVVRFLRNTRLYKDRPVCASAQGGENVEVDWDSNYYYRRYCFDQEIQRRLRVRLRPEEIKRARV